MKAIAHGESWEFRAAIVAVLGSISVVIGRLFPLKETNLNHLRRYCERRRKFNAFLPLEACGWLMLGLDHGLTIPPTRCFESSSIPRVVIHRDHEPRVEVISHIRIFSWRARALTIS